MSGTEHQAGSERVSVSGPRPAHPDKTKGPFPGEGDVLELQRLAGNQEHLAGSRASRVISSTEVLALQRAIGNAAVGRLLGRDEQQGSGLPLGSRGATS